MISHSVRTLAFLKEMVKYIVFLKTNKLSVFASDSFTISQFAKTSI